MSRQRLLLALIFASTLAPGAGVAASVEASVRDLAGQPVADAVVYAIPAGGGQDARPGRKVSIEQIDRDFVPYVSVVQSGTTATFPNRDPIMHHVYSFSPAKSFEIKLYTGKSPSEILLDKPGIVTLGCNIHDWMIAYIVVVPTAHFAKTGANGIARLRDLPAGVYELRSWHPQQRVGAAPQSMAVDAASASQASFVVDAQPRKPKFKPPLDRMRY
jgi:plastocyanin